MKINNKGNEKTTTRKVFSLVQKLAIVDRANLKGKKPTAKELGINVSQIHRWSKQHFAINQLCDKRGIDDVVRKRLDGAGRPTSIAQVIEDNLCDWFDNLRNETTNNGPVKVNVEMCVAKLRLLDNTLQEVSRTVLRRRIWRIFRRRGIVDRAVTHQLQRTRNDCDIISGWADYITQKMAMLQIGPENVCNFDETNVFFSPECKRTLARKGDRTVSALRADSSQRCSVMVGVSCSGHKFPPYIIYKGRNTLGGTINRQMKKVESMAAEVDVYEGFPTSLFYAVQEHGWMTSDLMVDWVEKVYRPWCRTKTGPTILILDEFTGHQTKEVRDAVVDCGGFVEYIPGGYTWKLQVMDVGLNKPFKDRIRDEYDRWFFANECQGKPHRDNIARWVKASFDSITTTNINNTWRHVGITVDNQTDEEMESNDNENEEDNDGALNDIDIGFATLGIEEDNEEETIMNQHYEDDNEKD
jgi:hypothetical protein